MLRLRACPEKEKKGNMRSEEGKLFENWKKLIEKWSKNTKILSNLKNRQTLTKIFVHCLVELQVDKTTVSITLKHRHSHENKTRLSFSHDQNIPSLLATLHSSGLKHTHSTHNNRTEKWKTHKIYGDRKYLRNQIEMIPSSALWQRFLRVFGKANCFGTKHFLSIPFPNHDQRPNELTKS